MSRESLIFLLVVLAIWGLSVAARWLQEEIEKNTTNEIEFEPIEESPSLETESVSKSKTLAQFEANKPLPSPTLDQEKKNASEKIIESIGFG